MIIALSQCKKHFIKLCRKVRKVEKSFVFLKRCRKDVFSSSINKQIVAMWKNHMEILR